MSKFRVGDRVRVSEAAGFSRGSVGTVTHIGFGPFDYGVLRDGASSSLGFGASELDLLVAAQPAGPVRMRPTIVPGVYGRVSVGAVHQHTDCHHPSGFKSDPTIVVSVGGFGMVMQQQTLNRSELRAAAATFIELADALDEVA